MASQGALSVTDTPQQVPFGPDDRAVLRVIEGTVYLGRDATVDATTGMPLYEQDGFTGNFKTAQTGGLLYAVTDTGETAELRWMRGL